MVEPKILEKLDHLPEKPGVYLMRDQGGKVIYVGKALSLKQRVRSYFQKGGSQSPKVKILVGKVADLEYIVTDSEVEALILECNLIKKYRPRYNVNLKDDKSYPYLKVTLQDKFPRLIITRSLVRDGAKYFGPFTSAGALQETVQLLRKIFRLRTCKNRELFNRQRPCLNYHIQRCDAPCMGYITPEAYGEVVKEVCLFLEGRQEALVRRLQEKMDKAALALDYEQAAVFRDQIQAIKQVLQRQKMVSPALKDQDIIAFAPNGNEACFQVFFVREGKVVGREHYILEGTEGLAKPEIMAAFLKRYYEGVPFIPREILLAEETAELEIIEEWLTGKRGRRVYLRVPQRGEKARLTQMVEKNAHLLLQEKQATRREEKEKTVAALEELAENLSLSLPPERIEGYDISNIRGTLAVGSMVVFTRGQPDKEEYRRFRIKTVIGPDDYAMLQEVLYRRFRRTLDTPRDDKGGGFDKIPDLIIVDGGKGQVRAAGEALRRVGFEDIPVLGLAEKKEHLFTPGQEEPLILPRDSEALFLLQRLRDEAHRFALEYHRSLRRKQLSRSLLDEVPGIGPRRKRALLTHFGSLGKISTASVGELTAVPGMNRGVAEAVYHFLREQGYGQDEDDIK
ncbi:MAG: excinuclease ABC subunit UvrC [Firmicutes bacterium]|nr:excinuclease ABC subunit UvrC [Bacillota bacterium]